MSHETAGAARATEIPTDGAVLALQNVYLKDCSYESPHVARVDANWNPQSRQEPHTASHALRPNEHCVTHRSPCSARVPGARHSPSSSRAAAGRCGCGAATAVGSPTWR